jgi:hypothetical protein
MGFRNSSLTHDLLILVFQFPVPAVSPEKGQNTGSEQKYREATSPTSVQSDSHPPSEDEVIDLECDEDAEQDSSMVYLPACYVLLVVNFHAALCTPTFLESWLH